MKYVSVVPAYGRDYKSAKAVKAAWAENKDFILRDFGNPFDGRPINKADAERAGYTVKIRYDGLRKVVVV